MVARRAREHEGVRHLAAHDCLDGMDCPSGGETCDDPRLAGHIGVLIDSAAALIRHELKLLNKPGTVDSRDLLLARGATWEILKLRPDAGAIEQRENRPQAASVFGMRRIVVFEKLLVV